MADAITVSGPVSGTDRTLSFETGKLAGQADGAVLARIGDTMVLVTATAARKVREGTDFFPLTVDIEERMYAAGKIPGSFFRREGRATDQAILTDRLIDRPLRPSFPEGFRNEVHIVGTTFGADLVNPHDVLAINGASAALMISGIPFDGPDRRRAHGLLDRGHVAAARHLPGGRRLDVRARRRRPGARHRGRRRDRHHDGRGRRNRGRLAVLRERRPEGDRGRHRRGPRGLEEVDPRVDRAAARARREGRPQGDHPVRAVRRLRRRRLRAASRPSAPSLITTANAITTKAERNAALDAATETIVEQLAPLYPEREREIKAAVRSFTKKIVRKRIVSEGIRIDGRGTTDIRPLSAEVGHHPDGARLRALPARRHPGAQLHDPRHAPDEPAARHDRHRRDQALHAPLQLPAVLDGRDGLHARPEAS